MNFEWARAGISARLSHPYQRLVTAVRRFTIDSGARYRHQAAVGERPLLSKLIEEFPELTRQETFLQVRQAADHARIEADRKASLLRLLRLLAWPGSIRSAAR